MGGADKWNERERFMKIEKYLKMLDDFETWRLVFREGGEELLREYSERVHDPERGLGTCREYAYKRRLVSAASHELKTEAEFFLIMDKIPERLRYLLLDNPNCTEAVIEALWIGNYTDRMGNPSPDIAAGTAYYHNHHKAVEVYRRRPDLRHVVSPAYHRLYLRALKREGKFPLQADANQIFEEIDGAVNTFVH